MTDFLAQWVQAAFQHITELDCDLAFSSRGNPAPLGTEYKCRLFQLGPSFLASLESSGKGLADERGMPFGGEQAPVITPRGGSQVLGWSSAESSWDKHAMLQASSLTGEWPPRQGPLRCSGSHRGHPWLPREKSQSQNPVWERLPPIPRDPDEGLQVRSRKLQVIWAQDSPAVESGPPGPQPL